MASGDDRDIKSFLEEKKIPKGAIEAVVKYGVETVADFRSLSEDELDNLEAKGFEKERLKQVWRELKDQTGCAAPPAAAGTVMHGGQGNIGGIQNTGHIGRAGNTYNQGPSGPGARQQNNYDNAKNNVQADKIDSLNM